jgi:acyl carrier protein
VKEEHTTQGKVDAAVFIAKFEAQFQELQPGEVTLATEFRQLAEWSSMQSLIVIASFDWEYGVTLSAEELMAARTVEDLFGIVSAKVSA